MPLSTHGIVLTNVPTEVGLGLSRSFFRLQPLTLPMRDDRDAIGPSALSDLAVLYHRILYWYRHPVDKRQLNVCTTAGSPFSPKGRCSRLLRLLTPYK